MLKNETVSNSWILNKGAPSFLIGGPKKFSSSIKWSSSNQSFCFLCRIFFFVGDGEEQLNGRFSLYYLLTLSLPIFPANKK